MVYVILGNGFEETEAIAPIDCLRRAGVNVCTLGISGFTISSSHQVSVLCDRTLDSLTPAEIDEAEMVLLPGGLGGVSAILESPAAVSLIQTCHQQGKLIAAICAAPSILATLGMLSGKKATVYPGMEAQLGDAQPQVGSQVVIDGNIITAEAAGSALEFGLTLVSCLRGKEAADAVAQSIHFHGQY